MFYSSSQETPSCVILTQAAQSNNKECAEVLSWDGHSNPGGLASHNKRRTALGTHTLSKTQWRNQKRQTKTKKAAADVESSDDGKSISGERGGRASSQNFLLPYLLHSPKKKIKGR